MLIIVIHLNDSLGVKGDGFYLKENRFLVVVMNERQCVMNFGGERRAAADVADVANSK